jgi:hypothetical protein
MSKEHLVKYQFKKGNKCATGANQHTKMRKLCEEIRKNLGIDTQELDDDEVRRLVKALTPFLITRNHKQIDEIKANADRAIIIDLMMKSYLGKDGYKQVRRDLGLDDSVEVTADNNLTIKFID